MDAERLAKIEDLCRIVIGLPDGADVAQMTRVNEPLWDSLAQVSLVVALEQEFGITFPLADRGRMNSFATVVEAVARFLGEPRRG